MCIDAGIEGGRDLAVAPSFASLRKAHAVLPQHEFTKMILILIDAHRRHDWLIGAVNKRLREEFAKLQVEINDEKSSGVPTPAYG
jgi:hypothetical protein